MLKRTTKLVGRRKAGCYGPPRKGNKRVANKATRRYIARMTYSIHQTEKDINPFTGGAPL